MTIKGMSPSAIAVFAMIEIFGDFIFQLTACTKLRTV